MKTQITTRNMVLEFIHALNTENYTAAKKWLNETFAFLGPMGTRNGADAYMSDMEKMKFKYTVENTFEEGNDVCLIYKIDIGGKTIRDIIIWRMEN